MQQGWPYTTLTTIDDKYLEFFNMMQQVPRLFRFILTVTAISLLVLFLLRVLFWLYFNNPSDPVPREDLLYGFYLGTKFDLRLTLYALLPLFLLGWIRWFSPFYNKVTHYVWLGYLVITATIVLLFYVTDFGHYAYLQKRVDATVFRFLDNFTTSSQMVWQSYNVIPWTLFIIALIAVHTYVIHKVLNYFAKQPAIHIKKRHKAWIAPASFFIFIFAIYGKFSYYPLRWSDAFFSNHAYAASVASNPVLYFFNTLKNKEIVYDVEKTKQHYDVITEYLGITNPDKQALNFKRVIQPQTQHQQPPNIVMVFLESFASYKTGAFGNKLNPTPYFDMLSDNGISFKHYYTPHTGTARSVFAAITGLPDIEPIKTSSRNPLVVKQHTIIRHFKDYEKFYFIGGSANWGNIRGVLSHNIPGLHLYEEGSYTSPRMDVWGISDLHLFEEAHWVLKEQSKPFFAIIQTSGNHRPYHIPEDNRGFKKTNLPQEQLHNAGFIGLSEYNSFRFMDHSLAFFMEAAKKSDYFDNTIFIFFGDHGIPGYAGTHSNPHITQLGLTNVQTPLVFYAPKLLPEPKEITYPASELDLLPTIASLAGVPHTNTSLGRDLFDTRFNDKRYAFTIIPRGGNSELGLISQDYFFQITQDGSDPKLFNLKAENARENVLEDAPNIAAEMQKYCFAIFETTKYMLHHNPHLP